METARKPARLRPQARSFVACLRQFLTPAVWKQAQQARPQTKTPSRWTTQPLVLVLLGMTWCCGDSLSERFETAKAFCIHSRSKRRRPGRTVEGWQKALAKLPSAVLRTVAAGVRRRVAAVLDLVTDGFVVVGCDGSRLECPRTAELEQRLGQAGKDHAAPTLWVTALVHLRTGVLWAWRLGKGTASERHHLRALLPTLPARALVVADAGFHGFDVAQALQAAGVAFLIRMSAKVSLYVRGAAVPTRWQDGPVDYWPTAQQRGGRPGLRLRLVCVRARRSRHAVWLLTNVPRPRLSRAQAGQYYRQRWENEGLFRTYKRTLGKVKLLSRTVRLVHREADGALLALQLLLAQGAQALARQRDGTLKCSARQVLREIRRELAVVPRRRGSYRTRLRQAVREPRPRCRAKEARVWPRRRPHRPPKPPQLRTLTDRQKALQARLKAA
jgi:hypothetical protein